MKTCCVTGHRRIPADKQALVEAELRKAIEAAIAEGCTRFISGFAAGIDLTFAGIVAEKKAQGLDLSLEAAIPYKKRLSSKDQPFQDLLTGCDAVTVLCEEYLPSCYQTRNQYMVNRSDLVIAVYDGRKKGGTYHTITYANRRHKALRIIEI